MSSQPKEKDLDFDKFPGCLPARLLEWRHTEGIGAHAGEKYTETFIRIGDLEFRLGDANVITITPKHQCSITDAHIVSRIGVGQGCILIDMGCMSVFAEYESPYENINVRDVGGPWDFLA